MGSSPAHALVLELRKLSAVLAGHQDPALSQAAGPSVLCGAADVLEALANQVIWIAGSGDELALLLCRMEGRAMSDLAVHGPGPDDNYTRRAEDATRAVYLGFRTLAHLAALRRNASES